jgi:hypothetical protein
MLVFQGSMGAEFGAVVGNIVHARTTLSRWVSISFSGFYGGAAKVFEGTATTSFSTSGMLAVQPPYESGDLFFSENPDLFSLLVDGKLLIHGITSQVLSEFHSQKYIEVGPVSPGVHSFTIRLQSTSEDLIYMSRGFSVGIKLSTPW